MSTSDLLPALKGEAFSRKEIARLIVNREYSRAKEKTLAWMIIRFPFGGIIVGVLPLVAYLKYDEVFRNTPHL